ncbi:MAG: MerR family transcriptional regulator [Anaerolineales bacterium]
MFKIGEFSRLGQVSIRMLRHYDQLGLLKPSQTDKFTSYRYYTIDQLSRLHRIIALKELGIPLEEIARLLGKSGQLSTEQLRGMLTLRQVEIAQELRTKQTQLVEVEARLQQIEHEGQPSPYEVVIKSVPAQPVASTRQTVPHISEMGYYCEMMFRELYGVLARNNVTPLQPEITIYHLDEYRETDLDVEATLGVQSKLLRQPPTDDGLTFRELPPSDLTAALIYEGPFRDMTPAVLALLKHVGTHRHIPAGPLRELHLSGPAHDAQGNDHPSPVVELQIPIRKIDE